MVGMVGLEGGIGGFQDSRRAVVPTSQSFVARDFHNSSK